mmetsp:Transcript_14274/g.42774  ORF Transcript_14274/g.42774 Transcript_14274/m.42774 type:complete len:204 (-) Transcript_14274:6355-6966(-)
MHGDPPRGVQGNTQETMTTTTVANLHRGGRPGDGARAVAAEGHPRCSVKHHHLGHIDDHTVVEAAKIRQNRRHVRSADAKPRGDGLPKALPRRRRNDAAAPNVELAVLGEVGGVRAKDLAAVERTAREHGLAAPACVGRRAFQILGCGFRGRDAPCGAIASYRGPCRRRCSLASARTRKRRRWWYHSTRPAALAPLPGSQAHC